MTSVLVYFSIIIISYIGLRISSQPKYHNGVVSINNQYTRLGFISVFVYLCLIKGLGYDMGDDYLGYCKIYENVKAGHEVSENLELGFLYLNKFLSIINFDLPGIFIVNSIIVFSCLFYATKSYQFCNYLIIPIWIASLYLSSNNLWRQFDACSISLVAYTYLLNTDRNKTLIYVVKRLVVFFLLMVLAFFFHKTAILSLIIWIISWLLSNKKIPVQYYIIAILIVRYASGYLAEYMFSLDLWYSYNNDKYDQSAFFENPSEQSSIGQILESVQSIIILVCADICLKKVNDNKINALFISSALLLIFLPIARISSLVYRVFLYQDFVLPIVLGYVLYKYNKEKGYPLLVKLPFYFVIIYKFILFSSSILEWDKNMGHSYMIYPF